VKIIIAGSRNFNDYLYLKYKTLKVFRELKELYPDTKREEIEIISGHQRGADTLGEQFAKEYGLNLKEFPANWDRDGRGAGPIRNAEMAVYGSQDPIRVLVAFWLNKSPGTKNMISLAQKFNFLTYVFELKEKYT
jgi:hypothetical protein